MTKNNSLNASKKTKKRTSYYDTQRGCYMADDGSTYSYSFYNTETHRYEVTTLIPGQDGVTKEMILVLDEMDHKEDLIERRENDHKDSLFESNRKIYQDNSSDENAVDPMFTIPDYSKDPAVVLFKEEKPEKKVLIRVRNVIDTECTPRQQEIYRAHYGEMETLEAIRKREVAATGKEKSPQAIYNANKKIIRKVANALGVGPLKRPKTCTE